MTAYCDIAINGQSFGQLSAGSSKMARGDENDHNAVYMTGAYNTALSAGTQIDMTYWTTGSMSIGGNVTYFKVFLL